LIKDPALAAKESIKWDRSVGTLSKFSVFKRLGKSSTQYFAMLFQFYVCISAETESNEQSILHQHRHRFHRSLHQHTVARREGWRGGLAEPGAMARHCRS